ncbi:hypothetical protein EIP91_011204, partial [Steccherinum ochraceum]
MNNNPNYVLSTANGFEHLLNSMVRYRNEDGAIVLKDQYDGAHPPLLLQHAAVPADWTQVLRRQRATGFWASWSLVEAICRNPPLHFEHQYYRTTDPTILSSQQCFHSSDVSKSGHSSLFNPGSNIPGTDAIKYPDYVTRHP